MIYILDTNFIWSLFDKEDENHGRSVEWIKNKQFNSLCIVPAVAIEYNNVSNKEYNKLIAQVIFNFDKNKENKIVLTKANTIIDQSSNELKNKNNINKTRLLRYTKRMHEFFSEIYINKEKLTIKDLKNQLTSFNVNINGFIQGKLAILIELGYTLPSIDSKNINLINQKMIDKGIKFEDSTDSIITGEILSFLKDNNDEYSFISYDKKFMNFIKNTFEIMNVKNIRTDFLNDL